MRLIREKKYGKPLYADSFITILGNFEYQLYQKSQRYAPVLKYISLRLLNAKSVVNKHILQQVYFKNAFSNEKLTDD